MAILSKNEILSANDSELTEIEVDEWGGSVFIGSMTVTERLDFDNKHGDSNGAFKNLNSAPFVFDLLSVSIKDENGEKMFSSDNIGLLKDKNAKVINRLLYECIKASYISEEAVSLLKKKSPEVL